MGRTIRTNLLWLDQCSTEPTGAHSDLMLRTVSRSLLAISRDCRSVRLRKPFQRTSDNMVPRMARYLHDFVDESND